MLINAIVFILEITLPNNLYQGMMDLFALHIWGSEQFRPHQLVTHLFMHGSWMHLVINMLTLWIFGSKLEKNWGAKRFFNFYMICGIGAALCHLGVLTFENMHLTKDIDAFMDNPTSQAFLEIHKNYDLNAGSYLVNDLASEVSLHPNDSSILEAAKIFLQNFITEYRNQVTLGASGAVYGICFAFGYLFPNTFPLNNIHIRAKFIVGTLIIFEVLAGFRNVAGDNVAHFAHLGGVLFSYILLKIWARTNRRDFY
ncbi:rhomboid family protein [Chitinophaga skermanii]|uniref:Rhomboid family protein n=2 Tax=Chitinophaga skermanii TaxID=331697 RepID=A0A327Q4C1_9BACT|nr:rhomboid family protein [Chitinophaga skermanii]